MPLTTPDLDNLDRLKLSSTDPEAMLSFINKMPEQVRTIHQSASIVALPDRLRSAQNILVLGMGGSAIGGDLLRGFVSGECRVPVSVSRDYDVPAWVDTETLVIAMSCSGNTEETLSAFGQATERTKRLLAVSTGGKLAGLAQQHDVPIVTFSYTGQPRAALGLLFTPLVTLLGRLGYISDASDDIMQSAALLDQGVAAWGADSPSSSNPTKRLAVALVGRLPVIYGAGHLDEVAHRWKTQMNENSKTWSFYEVFPELNHNAVVGYEYPMAQTQLTHVVILRSALIHPRVQTRINVTAQILQQHGVLHTILDAQGGTRLQEMFWTILYGDYMTYYLALLNGADPTVIGPIDFLKGELARS